MVARFAHLDQLDPWGCVDRRVFPDLRDKEGFNDLLVLPDLVDLSARPDQPELRDLSAKPDQPDLRDLLEACWDMRIFMH